MRKFMSTANCEVKSSLTVHGRKELKPWRPRRLQDQLVSRICTAVIHAHPHEDLHGLEMEANLTIDEAPPHFLCFIKNPKLRLTLA